MTKAAFANGVWFKAERAERGDFDPDHEEGNEEEMCKGCIFNGKGIKVCKAAEVAALAAGLPDCESRGTEPGYRYVRGHQDDLLGGA